MTPTQRLAATIVAIILIGGGTYYYFGTAPALTPGSVATSTPSTATSTGSSQTKGNANLELVTPDYHKPIVFGTGVSADTRTLANQVLKTAQAAIDKNKLNVQAWVDLGTAHKMGGDYTVAAEYWEYITSVYTGTGAPFYGLGDLYENFIHDYVKAEADYKMAIQQNPNNIDAYASLYTMYHYTLHDDAKAAAILTAGLKANPGNNYLLGLQAELK